MKGAALLRHPTPNANRPIRATRCLYGLGTNAGLKGSVSSRAKSGSVYFSLCLSLCPSAGKHHIILLTVQFGARADRSHGRLMLTVLAGLAEFERELIRARTGEGRESQGLGCAAWAQAEAHTKSG